MGLTRLEDINRAVEMTARCKTVEHCWQAPADSRWMAVLWWGSDYVTGYGPDAWTAVQSAHALASMERRRRGYDD